MPARSSIPITSPGPEPRSETSTSQPRVTICGTVSTPSLLTPAVPASSRHGPAVVAAVADLQVAERVEVGAELHRAGDQLGDPVDLVLPHRRRRVGVVRGGDERLAGRSGRGTPGRSRRGRGRGRTSGPSRTSASASRRLASSMWLSMPSWSSAPKGDGHQVIGRGAHRHSDDQGSRKLGKSVRPPSTKIVCPVM